MLNKKDVTKEGASKVEERGHWGSKVEFLLAVAGNVVGLGNVWRFPYLCYKNGGGAFLVPYLIFVVTCGLPLFLLETTIGQYTQAGGITCWRKLCPLAEDDCIDFSTQNKTFEWTNQTNSTSAATEFWEYVDVVYFTATFPYVMLVILLIRGLSLPGALQGVLYYLLPELSRLTDPQVWMEAGAQIFFSYSVGVGSLTVLGSYNTYNNNCYTDSLWLCLLNSCTSVVAGFAVFSVLGFMAHEQGVPIAEVAESGNASHHRYSELCNLVFLYTIFVAMEVVMTSIIDLFPTVMRRAGRREGLLLLFCFICFFSQLVMITEGGMYVFQMFDYYAWAGRLFGIIKDMTGVQPNPFFKICWLYLTPLVSLGSFICSLVEYQPLTFNRWYVYPAWTYVLGWLMALSSILLVPGWALYKLGTGTGNLTQRFHHLCRPEPDCSLTQKRETELQHIEG
ncbi:hypothetical protein FQN60_004670, partial [Etheostoma spectabile]